jgi:hypothetical protein
VFHEPKFIGTSVSIITDDETGEPIGFVSSRNSEAVGFCDFTDMDEGDRVDAIQSALVRPETFREGLESCRRSDLEK